MNDLLRKAPKVGAYYGRDLSEADGLNIEGIAVAGGRVFVGLRAPSIGGKAFLIEGGADKLFAKEDPAPAGPSEPVSLELGDGVGIRDLALLDGGRLLVLSGSTREQSGIPFRLYWAEPKTGGALRLLATLEDVLDEDGNRAKPEAVLPLDGIGKRVFVLFDGLDNGGPRIYE